MGRVSIEEGSTKARDYQILTSQTLVSGISEVHEHEQHNDLSLSTAVGVIPVELGGIPRELEVRERLRWVTWAWENLLDSPSTAKQAPPPR